MVCIYCGAATRVGNSRPQKRLLQVWRRRICTACGAVFTTNEAVDLSTSISVGTPNGRLRPFSRDKLFVSVLRAVGHRKAPLDDANALTATIIGKLLHTSSEAVWQPSRIVTVTAETLQRFDTAAAVQYQAYHQQ